MAGIAQYFSPPDKKSDKPQSSNENNESPNVEAKTNGTAVSNSKGESKLKLNKKRKQITLDGKDVEPVELKKKIKSTEGETAVHATGVDEGKKEEIVCPNGCGKKYTRAGFLAKHLTTCNKENISAIDSPIVKGGEKKSKKKKENLVYEVEAVVEHKVLDGEVYYLIKWKGYPDSDRSWEVESQLSEYTRDLYWQTLGKPHPLLKVSQNGKTTPHEGQKMP